MIRGALRAVVCVLVLGLSARTGAAQSYPLSLDDPRGEPELMICSQNLANFGPLNEVKRRDVRKSAAQLEAQADALVERFVRAKCDVIAVQEVIGRSDQDALAGLAQLTSRLRKKSGRFYDARIGVSNDPLSRNAFLIARDAGAVENTVSYSRVELPKLLPKERPRLFVRGPYEVQLKVRGKGDAPARVVTLVTFHFKSRGGRARDPAELQWETYRMQMAEALRRVVENRHAAQFASGESILVLLGDRNSHHDTASAELLTGKLVLDNFRKGGACRLTDRGVPVCKQAVALPQRLFSVLTADPETGLRPGTYRYQNVFSWLDDILMPAESLSYARERFDREGDYASGVLTEPSDGLDHAMVFTRLNW